MIEQPINDNNFIQTAMRHYDNPQCTSVAEFEEDIKRFAYLKKLFNRYTENNDLRERLILNHLIILHNVFGVVTTELLFFKIDKQYWNILVTFLIFLNKMPEEVPEFSIRATNFNLDPQIINKLRSI